MPLSSIILIGYGVIAALGAVANILTIGKERRPTTPGVALTVTLMAVLLDVAIYVTLSR